MIKFSNVSFKYPDNEKLVLKNINFEIKKGEWITILGNNGSGKTTIAKLLCGQFGNYSGEIIVDEEVCSTENFEKIISNIAMVFQNPDNQFIGMTVEEDIAFGLENKNYSRQDMKAIISDVLKIVDMLEYQQSEPKYLSGGQKQRIAIASSIALNPKILILDEATSMLDNASKNEILNYIKKISIENNITVLSITHDVEELRYSDKILLIDNGIIIKEDKSIDFYKNKKLLKEYKIDIPFFDKIKYDFNNNFKEKIFKEDDDLERITDKLCKLILKM